MIWIIAALASLGNMQAGHAQTANADVTANDGTNILFEAYRQVAAMPDFAIEEIKNNSDYGFPAAFGKGRFTGYGNSDPKADVLRVLEIVPAKYLKYENVDSRGKIRRLYVDSSDKNNVKTLFFFGGIGGNDLIVAYFENGNGSEIGDYIQALNQ